MISRGIYKKSISHITTTYRIRSNFQMARKAAVKDFENNTFENEAGIQLAIICHFKILFLKILHGYRNIHIVI